MITAWLVKVVLGIGLFGLAIFEAGSPFVTRVQVDDAAHRVADEAARSYFETQDLAQARAVAEAEAASRSVVVTGFALTEAGPLRVTVFREARSVVMHNVSFAKEWYDVSAAAESLPRRRDL